MATDDWPDNWPDIRNVPYSDWPETIRAIDKEMKILIKLKAPDQLELAMKRLQKVLDAQRKTLKDVYALAAASRLPLWRGALENIGALALRGAGHQHVGSRGGV